MVARPLAAQDELHLGELYRAVLAASPRIAAADARAGAAAARVASTRRPPDPELQFGAMGRSLPGLGYSDPLGMDQLQLMQMVPFPGKLGAAGQAAQARAEAARAEALDVAWGVRARAAERFYALYRIGAQLAVARETRRLLEDITRTAAAMYGVGEGRQTDLLRAQVELARMDEEIIRLEAERTAEAAGLNALLARGPAAPMGEPVLPAFPDTLPALDSLLAEAASRRPMVQADAAEVRAADADARRARRELWPDLQLGVQYAWRPMPGGGSDRMGSLMVGVTLPVFAGSRQLAMRRETEAMAAMAR
ncbi:MAG TPA: TolC family protein, partial [Gemmatimonadales bacterium]|nr:TolC family protein [Gemmatimonadales bacterium]